MQTDAQDQSALGWDHQEQLAKHESQKGNHSDKGQRSNLTIQNVQESGLFHCECGFLKVLDYPYPDKNLKDGLI